MDINLEQLFVGLVVLVPGFISTNVLRNIEPRRFRSDLDRIVESLLISIYLNFILILLFSLVGWVIFGWSDFNSPIGELDWDEFTPIEVVVYFICLFLFAVYWGYFLGTNPNFNPKGFFKRFRKGIWSDELSVWKSTIKKKPKKRPITWITVKVEDGRTLFGHLKRDSLFIKGSEPIEVFLDEVYEITESGDYEQLEGDGVYIRLNPEQAAQIHFKSRGWSPSSGFSKI